jgi:type IV secretory pathway VirB10-like protein
MQQQQQLGLPGVCVMSGRQYAAFCRATDGSGSDDDPPSPRRAPAAASPAASAPPRTPAAISPPPRAARRPVVPLEQLEEALICPITQLRLEDPVVAADGHTYERQAIESALAASLPQLAASSLSRAASGPPL